MRFLKTFIFSGVFVWAISSSIAFAQEQVSKETIYEKPTIKNLSQLYWRLSKFTPDENGEILNIFIDNFLFINECGLYQEFYDNEFEWQKMRKSTRAFLDEVKDDFPRRFEYMQPLRLGAYDLENEVFDVWEPYKISGVRRFEVLAEDIFSDVCGQLARYAIQGYPKGLFVEMNRPFTLETIQVPPEVAQIFIKSKKRYGGIDTVSKESLYEQRDAYLVIKMKIYSYQGAEYIANSADQLAKVIGIMEAYEIYGDKEKELLLYAKDFKRKKDRSKIEKELKKRYQERLKKQMEEKKKSLQEEDAPTESTSN